MVLLDFCTAKPANYHHRSHCKLHSKTTWVFCYAQFDKIELRLACFLAIANSMPQAAFSRPGLEATGVYFTSLSEDCQRVLGMLNTYAGGHIVYRSSSLLPW